jgi:hypothetical protein
MAPLKFKYLIYFMIILPMIGCGKTQNDLNPAILGDWQLIEVYGVKDDNTLGWITIPTSHIQTINFNSNGEYTLASDGNKYCTGNFVFEGNSSIKLKPIGCMPLMESLETIYTLTKDTLTISNKSSSISSFNLRRDKYISINSSKK